MDSFSDWENSVRKEDQSTTTLVKDHNCHRTWRPRTFSRCFTLDQDEVRFGGSILPVRSALLCLPVAVQGEGCSQRIVHDRSRVQVGCREQPQQQHTDCSLSCPVQRRSLGSACKEKHSQGKAPLPRAGGMALRCGQSANQNPAQQYLETQCEHQPRLKTSRTGSVKLSMQHPEVLS